MVRVSARFEIARVRVSARFEIVRVRVSARFEIARVRVSLSQLYWGTPSQRVLSFGASIFGVKMGMDFAH